MRPAAFPLNVASHCVPPEIASSPCSGVRSELRRKNKTARVLKHHRQVPGEDPPGEAADVVAEGAAGCRAGDIDHLEVGAPQTRVSPEPVDTNQNLVAAAEPKLVASKYRQELKSCDCSSHGPNRAKSRSSNSQFAVHMTLHPALVDHPSRLRVLLRHLRMNLRSWLSVVHPSIQSWGGVLWVPPGPDP